MKTHLLSRLAASTAAVLASLAVVSSVHAQGGNTRPTTPVTPVAPVTPIGPGGGGGIIGVLPVLPGGGGGGTTSNTPTIIAAQGVLTGEPAQAAVVIPSQIATGATSTDTGATGLAYQWTISGGRILSATNTQAITYIADTAGTVTLNVTITSNGSTATANVTAVSPATAGTITAPSTTVMSTGNTGATISATVPAAVSSDRTFRWTVTGDAAIVGAATNNTVTIRAGTAGLKQINCAVRLQNLVTVDLTSFLVVTGNGPEVAVTVNGGSGGGTWRGGSRIDVLANPPPAGQVFDRWTGDVAAFNGANANNTNLLAQIAHQIVNVPNTPVTLTATYKPAPAWRPTVVTSFNPQTQAATQNQAATTVSTTLQHYVPTGAQGLVFLLHDSGGAAGEWFQRPQQILLVRDLVAAGYGVAALNSINRNAGTWAAQTTLTANLDALNHYAAVTRLITDNAITAATPIFFLGTGTGGDSAVRFADLIATGVAAQGTTPAIPARTVKGAVLYNTPGIEALAVASKVPQFYALAANDNTLGNNGLATARTNSQLLTGRGLATGFINTAASPVFANRFLALGLTGTAVTDTDAQAIHAAIRAAKLIDDNSYAKSVPAVETLRTALPAAYQDRTADVRTEIGVAYADGQFFADANARVINFLTGRVTNAATAAPGRLVNLSTRSIITSVGDTFALGFNISANPGTNDRATLLIRGIGPALRAFGLSTALAAPRLELYNASGALLSANEGWDRQAAGGATAQQITQAAAAVGAFALTAGSNDAAIVVQLQPGTYTVSLKGVNGVIGDVLAEVYDVSRNGTRLTNLSTLAKITDEGDAVVPGIVVAGNNPRTVLVRAVGPGLSTFGLSSSDLLGDPRLTVLNGNATVTTNNNWSQAAAAGGQAAALTAAFPAVGAFALTANSADSALVSALAPAAYTIRADAAPFVVNPNNQQAIIQPNPTGRVLVEVYEVP